MTEPEQAEAAEPRTIEFYGETFALSDRMGFLALSRFYRAGKRNVDSNSIEGMLALADLVEQLIVPEDWNRFEALADEKRATGDEMWEVVSDATEVLAGRPTVRSSDSSDGPTPTHLKSVPDVVKEAIEEFPGNISAQMAVPGVREALSA